MHPKNPFLSTKLPIHPDDRTPLTPSLVVQYRRMMVTSRPTLSKADGNRLPSVVVRDVDDFYSRLLGNPLALVATKFRGDGNIIILIIDHARKVVFLLLDLDFWSLCDTFLMTKTFESFFVGELVDIAVLKRNRRWIARNDTLDLEIL